MKDYASWVNAALQAWANKLNDLDTVKDSGGEIIIGPRRVQIVRTDDVSNLVIDGRIEARVRVEVLGG